MKFSRYLLATLLLACVALSLAHKDKDKKKDKKKDDKEADLIDDGTSVIYITFHGGSTGVNSVYSYTTSGSYIGDVLSTNSTLSELRGMLIMNDGSLLVANAYKLDSRIATFSTCNSNGQRSELNDFASTNLAHPYGLAFGSYQGQQAVFASNQDTNDVSIFSVADGSFLGNPFTFSSDAIRGIAYDPTRQYLWVADEDANSVYAFNTSTGQQDQSATISINQPVGVYYDLSLDSLFVGSKSDNYVLGLSLATQKTQNFSKSTLSHPAGIARLGTSLLVISQDTNNVLAFDIATASYLGVAVNNLPDSPEQIIISSC